MRTQITPDERMLAFLNRTEKIAMRRAFCDDAQLEKLRAAHDKPSAKKCAALLATAEGKMFKLRYDVDHYKSIEKHVGKMLDIVEIKSLNSFLMVVNDNGYQLKLPPNWLATMLYGAGVNILGNVVFAKSGFWDGKPDLVGSTEAEIQKLGDKFIKMTNGAVHWGKNGGEYLNV